MDVDIAIETEALGKRYRLGAAIQHDRLGEAIASAMRRMLSGEREDEGRIWALRDLDVEVARGEVLGVLGRNGSGKTTLLKVLAKITPPTTGRAVLHGRVGSLLEIGTGFHPDLTGADNIFLNGSILGMRRREIEARYDDIVEFAGLGRFLETPVKRYSSGMRVRLAFAVAAHLETEILLIDEVLAVGDAAFQRRCLGKMGDVARSGRTVVFVSHDMSAVSGLCTRGVVLEEGQKVFDGDTEGAISVYMELNRESSHVDLRERDDRRGNGAIQFTETWVEDAAGNRTDTVLVGEPVTIVAFYGSERHDVLASLEVSFAVYGIGRAKVTDLWNVAAGFDWEHVPGSAEVRCHLPRLSLGPGHYTYNVYGKVRGQVADWVENAGAFDVQQGDFFGSGRLPGSAQFYLPQEWDLDPTR